MAGELYEVSRFSDPGLADAMRKQLRYDVLKGAIVPVQQQLIIEALARLLERDADPAPGLMHKGNAKTIVEGK